MSGEFLSGFSKFFTNLTTAQRQELDRAFADIQNSKEMTSLDTSLRNLRRKPDQLLPIPQLVVTTSIRGATVEWIPLTDQRINFYEVDISTFSNFASKTLVTTFGVDIVIDGLLATKYVRVRGVRRDGTTTPYSETITVTPQAFSINARALQSFYIQLTGTSAHSVLGGADTVMEYTPINEDANSMCWGFFTAYGDPATAMMGRSEIVVSTYVTKTSHTGDVLSLEEAWRTTLGEGWNSLDIGPFVIAHPPIGGSIKIEVWGQDGTTDENGDPRIVGDNTLITWCHLNVFETGSS
jgi:hypothetical protein